MWGSLWGSGGSRTTKPKWIKRLERISRFRCKTLNDAPYGVMQTQVSDSPAALQRLGNHPESEFMTRHLVAPADVSRMNR